MRYKLKYKRTDRIDAFQFFIGKTKPIRHVCFCKRSNKIYVSSHNLYWPHVHPSAMKEHFGCKKKDHITLINDGDWIVFSCEYGDEIQIIPDMEFNLFIKDYERQ